MIKSLTIAFLTARHDPKLHWFMESLDRETGNDYSNTKVIVVSTYDPPIERWKPHWEKSVQLVKPKPTIWSGDHRITKENWWSKCNSANTAIALCDSEWLGLVDDRSVLAHGWLQCVQDSMIHTYAVCGSYTKHANLGVVKGEVTDEGSILGGDVRKQLGYPVPSYDWYGGSCALPLEWCMKVNGFPEDICDGLGFEDVAFGILLKNNKFPIRYDSRMKLFEDRTQGQIDGALKRASKPSPDPDRPLLAKDYQILAKMNASFSSGNSFNIRELRDKVLAGEPFPPPTASHYDWFDNQPIAEMT